MQSRRPPSPGSPPSPALELRVSVSGQTLELWRDGALARAYPISTSAVGTGTEPGSLRTPTGRFRVCERYGDGAPAGAVFRSRIPTGEIAAQGGDRDLVLTRILWLDGVEPHNVNTRERYIYIHGTNQEALLGQPASAGCIRMRNADVIELFDLVRPDTPVVIDP